MENILKITKTKPYTINIEGRLTTNQKYLLDMIKIYGLENIKFATTTGKYVATSVILNIKEDGTFTIGDETITHFGNSVENMTACIHSPKLHSHGELELIGKKYGFGGTVQRTVIAVYGDTLYFTGYDSYHRSSLDLNKEVGYTGKTYREYFL